MNDTHQYFIDVLQQAADTFKVEDAFPMPGEKGTAKKPAEVDMRNYFSALNLQQTEEDNDEEDTVLPEPVVSAAHPEEDYELDESPAFILSFMAFCFFEDLHAVQGEVRRAWKSYKNGNTPIFTPIIICRRVCRSHGLGHLRYIPFYESEQFVQSPH